MPICLFCIVLYRCHSVFHWKKSVSSLPQGNESLYPGFAFLPIYFSRVTLQFRHPLFCVFVFFSLISSLFHLFSLVQRPSTCMKVCVAKHSALGLHCLFHVRTSGDIKGLLRGLSVCISSAPTVCAQDPGMRSAFHLITHRLKALVGGEQHACTCWL